MMKYVMDCGAQVYKTLSGYILTEGNRNNTSFTNTPKSLGHQYTTLARRLEAPKLDFKNGFRTRLQECADVDFTYFPVNCWTGNILRALSHQEVQAFEKAFDAHVAVGWEDDEEKDEEWRKRVVAEEVTCQARHFQCLQVQDTFKHDCAVIGCLKNGKPCKDHGKTLVVGQKKVELLELLVERYTFDIAMVVLGPFMGSGACLEFILHCGVVNGGENLKLHS